MDGTLFYGFTSIFSFNYFTVQLSTTEWMILLCTLLLCWLGMIDKRLTQCCQTLISWKCTLTQSLNRCDNLDVLIHFHNFLRFVWLGRNTFLLDFHCFPRHLQPKQNNGRNIKITKKCSVNDSRSKRLLRAEFL